MLSKLQSDMLEALKGGGITREELMKNTQAPWLKIKDILCELRISKMVNSFKNYTSQRIMWYLTMSKMQLEILEALAIESDVSKKESTIFLRKEVGLSEDEIKSVWKSYINLKKGSLLRKELVNILEAPRTTIYDNLSKLEKAFLISSHELYIDRDFKNSPDKILGHVLTQLSNKRHIKIGRPPVMWKLGRKDDDY